MESDRSENDPESGVYYSKHHGRRRRRGSEQGATTTIFGPSLHRYLRHENPALALLAWTCAILMILIIIIGAVALVGYIFLHPRPPRYHVQDIVVRSLGVSMASPFAFIASAIMNADLSLVIKIENPNTKVEVYYDRITMSVYFDEFRIGAVSLAPFAQGKRLATVVERDVEAYNVVVPRSVGSALLGSITRENVALRVVFEVKMRMKIGVLKTPRFKFVERCVLNVRPSLDFSRGASLLSKSCNSDVKL